MLSDNSPFRLSGKIGDVSGIKKENWSEEGSQNHEKENENLDRKMDIGELEESSQDQNEATIKKLRENLAKLKGENRASGIGKESVMSNVKNDAS